MQAISWMWPQQVGHCSHAPVLLWIGLCCAPASIAQKFNVRQYGAKGDGKTDDTHAFEAAVLAVARAGGGTLIVPASGNYLIRPINLTSSLDLYIQGGAKITGVADRDSWPVIPPAPSYGQGRDTGPRSRRYTSLLHGEHLSDITIRGDGNSSIVDGQGAYWWDGWRDLLRHTRGHLIEFMYSRNIKIHHIAMRNSPFWNNHFLDCDGVHVNHVSVEAPQHSDNTDGWDPDSSRNVLIENSWYSGGDDCVAIKSGWDCFGLAYAKPSVNITIRNLTCHGRFAGIALGSEMSGGIDNVLVSNVRFTLANCPAHIKTGVPRGGYVTNVRFENISVQGIVKSGIFVDATYDSNNPSCPRGWKPPAKTLMANYSFVNFDGRSAAVQKHVFHFKGSSSQTQIEGVYLENLHFRSTNSRLEPDWRCKYVSGKVKSGTVEPGPVCDAFKPSTALHAKQKVRVRAHGSLFRQFDS